MAPNILLRSRRFGTLPSVHSDQRNFRNCQCRLLSAGACSSRHQLSQALLLGNRATYCRNNHADLHFGIALRIRCTKHLYIVDYLRNPNIFGWSSSRSSTTGSFLFGLCWLVRRLGSYIAPSHRRASTDTNHRKVIRSRHRKHALFHLVPSHHLVCVDIYFFCEPPVRASSSL